MPFFTSWREKMADFISPDNTSKRKYKTTADVQVSVYDSSKASSSKDPSSTSGPIPSPPPFKFANQISQSGVVKPRITISRNPVNRYRTFSKDDFITLKRMDLMGEGLEEKLAGAWHGDIDAIRQVLDLLLREDVVSAKQKREAEEEAKATSKMAQEGRNPLMSSSVEDFFRDGANKQQTDTYTSTLVTKAGPAQDKDVEILISRKDQKVYVRKLDNQLYQVKVLVPDTRSKKAVAKRHRQVEAEINEKRHFVESDLIGDEVGWEVVDDIGDGDDRVAAHVRKQAQQSSRLNALNGNGRGGDWDDCNV